MEQVLNQPEFLIEYFAGITKGDFYEESVQGEYPDWQMESWVDSQFILGN